LIDESGTYAVLRAATGEAGKQMIEQGHQLKVGETGIVGYVTDMGTARVALNVDTDPTHYRNPLLPETRSEIALPLKVSGKIIGALDVQSTQAAAFDQESINILQTMADQLGVAIDNARLFRDMEEALSDLKAAQGRLTKEAWRNLHEHTGKILGYRYRGLTVEPATTRNPEAQEALMRGKTVLTSIQPGTEGLAASNDLTALAIPMKIRNQVVGVLNLRFAGQSPSNESVYIFEEIANRLALVLENLRLLEDAQRIATREQQVNLIATQIRRSANIEAILQNTVSELGKALGTSRTFIQIGVDLSSQEEEMV
jgi:GAF domain-containing protein